MVLAADPYLILGIVLLGIILFIINIYSLVHFQYPLDSNQSIIARVIILLAMQVSIMSVLFLPIDIANNSGNFYPFKYLFIYQTNYLSNCITIYLSKLKVIYFVILHII
jgi:hypothetical protein